MLKYKLVFTIKELNEASKDGYMFVESLDLNTWMVAKEDNSSVFENEAPKEVVLATKEEVVEEPKKEAKATVEVPTELPETIKESKGTPKTVEVPSGETLTTDKVFQKIEENAKPVKLPKK